tara:strand:- start:112 stop:459 length:348 start_codon:yes stop_codon:yes gene_type:complete
MIDYLANTHKQALEVGRRVVTEYVRHGDDKTTILSPDSMPSSVQFSTRMHTVYDGLRSHVTAGCKHQHDDSVSTAERIYGMEGELTPLRWLAISKYTALFLNLDHAACPSHSPLD